MARQEEMNMNEDEELQAEIDEAHRDLYDEHASWEEDEDSILDFAPDDGPRHYENDDYHHEDM